ncbi:hypothetical protein ARMGADRAFT_1028298 [Armillaria gallica]|uniref:Uncharacterized protein n=1 Tax=Armillaria gallica TaxID=47427 RepID=A0A2H3DXC5_ARMGA|nr:hypothetical protein ARMGADRAFT_1028298 [Armillaria gallica]
MNWAFVCPAFIQYGDNYYSVFSALTDEGPWWRAYYLIACITGGISTLLVDVTIIWRCWVVWDRQWRIISLPGICAIAAMIMKTMQILNDLHNYTYDISNTRLFAQNIDWSLIYALLVLATNLICTLLIVYRIIRFAQRLFLFRSIISALIESSAIYTLVLIVYLALVGRNMMVAYYADMVAAYIRAFSPTFLVLRVAARPTSGEDTNSKMTASSDLSVIHFTPLDENSCDDVCEENIPQSHSRTGTTEIV